MIEKELGTGKWIRFMPGTKDLAGWNRLLGEWTLEEDGSLLATPGPKGTMLNGAARVGADFEIRGKTEFVSRESKEDGYHAGVVFGRPRFGRSTWLSLRLNRTEQSGWAFVTQSWRSRRDAHAVTLTERNSFALRSLKERITASVNGEVIEQGYTPEEGFVRAQGALVGLGGYGGNNHYTVRYRNVELRRLDPSVTRGSVERSRSRGRVRRP